MELAIQIQNLDEAVCISHCDNNFGKDMNPSFLPSVIGKYKSRQDYLAMVRQPVCEKKNFKFKPSALY